MALRFRLCFTSAFVRLRRDKSARQGCLHLRPHRPVPPFPGPRPFGGEWSRVNTSNQRTASLKSATCNGTLSSDPAANPADEAALRCDKATVSHDMAALSDDITALFDDKATLRCDMTGLSHDEMTMSDDEPTLRPRKASLRHDLTALSHRSVIL